MGLVLVNVQSSVNKRFLRLPSLEANRRVRLRHSVTTSYRQYIAFVPGLKARALGSCRVLFH